MPSKTVETFAKACTRGTPAITIRTETCVGLCIRLEMPLRCCLNFFVRFAYDNYYFLWHRSYDHRLQDRSAQHKLLHSSAISSKRTGFLLAARTRFAAEADHWNERTVSLDWLDNSKTMITNVIFLSAGDHFFYLPSFSTWLLGKWGGVCLGRSILKYAIFKLICWEVSPQLQYLLDTDWKSIMIFQ